MARLTESWLLFWLSWERDLSLLLLELIFVLRHTRECSDILAYSDELIIILYGCHSEQNEKMAVGTHATTRLSD